MSMETFQNVDEWLISADVSSVLASCWKDAEPVPGLDDDDGDTSYLTPTCIDDDFTCYDVTDCLNSPAQHLASECWLDINEVLPCDGKVSDHLLTGQTSDREVEANDLGVQSSVSLGGDSEQLAEVNIGELESLLLIDDEGETAGGGYVTVDSSDVGLLLGNSTKMQFDFVHDVKKGEPAMVSYDVSEDSSTSSEDDDDSGDATWSYRARATRRQHRQYRRRSRPSRRRMSTPARSRVADERKKQQNKSAATRYREKKRSEEMSTELLCAALERRNKELQTRVRDMTQEVATLRQLVIDVFRR